MNIKIVQFSRNKYVLVIIENDDIYFKSSFLIKISNRIPHLNFKEFINLMINKFNAFKFEGLESHHFYFKSYQNANKAKEWIEQYLVIDKLSK